MTETPKIKLPRDYERVVLPDGREHKTWAAKLIVPVHTARAVSPMFTSYDGDFADVAYQAAYTTHTYIDTGVVDNLGRRVFERDPVEFMAERLLQ